MRVWTIQPIEVYNLIQEKGYFFCDPSKADLIIEFPTFNKAYIWLSKKMKEKIGNTPNNI